ncbi:superoxide dismutase [Fe] 3, chloroplastic-like isoform X2 [Aristolochia californica]|uniref:superoxide dismutase [Fe] 3, chloroplastic-like isoform X2 n=1 Tax=Aristolochia californica TaxID=171875 RepID=UPI0035DE1EFC
MCETRREKIAVTKTSNAPHYQFLFSFLSTSFYNHKYWCSLLLNLQLSNCLDYKDDRGKYINVFINHLVSAFSDGTHGSGRGLC